MEEETKKHVDLLEYRTRYYLASASDIAFKELFSQMRKYWSFIHGEPCPFHILENVKRKGE